MLCIIIDFLETSILFEKFLTMIALHKNICLFQVQLNLELGGPLVWQFCVKVLPLRHKLMEFTTHGSIFPKVTCILKSSYQFLPFMFQEEEKASCQVGPGNVMYWMLTSR